MEFVKKPITCFVEHVKNFWVGSKLDKKKKLAIAWKNQASIGTDIYYTGTDIYCIGTGIFLHRYWYFTTSLSKRYHNV